MDEADHSTPVTRRTYVKRQRATGEEETRRRILDAATELLAKEPAQAVSVDRIAKAAGVARSTIYVVFGDRTGLFRSLGHDYLEQHGFDRLVAAVNQPDARQALLASLREGARLYAEGRDVGRALFALSLVDPDAAEAIIVMDHGRAESMNWMAQRLRDQGQLRSDVGVAEAADVLWVLTGFETFDALYTGRKLSASTVAKRLVGMAERDLLVPEA